MGRRSRISHCIWEGDVRGMAVIGIDLGTTNSLVSVYRGGKVEIVKNIFEENYIPSAVAVDENERILVGKPAKERIYCNPKDCVIEFKRQMGSMEKIEVGNKSYLPEELSAFVLKKCKEEAGIYLNEEVTEAVISVPAYFDNQQREATKRAAKIAGLVCNRIINEPSAAALAHRMKTGIDEEQYILVIDFGGGTLDVSLVDCFENIVEIVGVSGNNKLGGKNFDEQIAKEFLKENQIEAESLSPEEYSLVTRKAEEAKIALGEKEQFTMSCKLKDKVYTMVLTNDKLLSFTGNLLLALKEVMVKVIQDAGCTIGEITDVLPVGGCCRLKIIQNYLKELFHREIVVSDDIQELVVKGLGYYIGIMQQKAGMEEILVTDVCPFSLGVNTSGASINEVMSVIIPRNSTLPKKATKEYVSMSAEQEEMVFSVYQGENYYAEENKKLGEIRIELPKKVEERKKVLTTFSYDINGILCVEVKNSQGITKKKKLLGTGSVSSDKNIFDEQYLPRELEEYTAIHEKLKHLFAEANERNREEISRWLMSIEYAKEHQGYVENIKLLRYVKRCMKGYEEYINGDNIFKIFDYSYDEELVEVFERAAEKAFTSLIEEHSTEHFYYFTMIIDEALKPYISAWSYEALEECLAEKELENDEERLWYKWGACESPYAGYGYDENFSECENLLDKRETIADKIHEEAGTYEEIDKEFELLINSMEEAMRRLDEKGLFGTGDEREGIVIMAEIIPPEASNNDRALRLNKNGLIEEYLEDNANLYEEDEDY